MKDEELYLMKVRWFEDQEIDEVTPLEVYREVFPAGSFQKHDDFSIKRGNGVIIYEVDTKEGPRKRHHHIYDDTFEEDIKKFYGQNNVLIRGASFIGRSAKNEDASMFYAFIFDLDGQGITELGDTLHQMNNGILPKATFTVLSGHGLHLYYVLDKPIRANQENIRKLNKLKYGLTRLIWNQYTSTIKKKQYQNAMQSFRMVGSASKMGPEYPVRAYRTNHEHYSLEELVSWIPDLKEWDEYRVNFQKKDQLRLELARLKYPAWYQDRIVEGKPRKRWNIKRDLYDWWKRQIIDGAVEGHRYFCVMCLAIYAIKCNISEEELRQDAYDLIDILDAKSDDNRFTKEDVDAALNGYNPNFFLWSRDKIGLISAIDMPINKRNGRKQAEHLARARAVQELDYPEGSWRNKDGRPIGSGTKAEQVQAWRKANPEGKKADCQRDTGIDPKTIRKWWDYDAEANKEIAAKSPKEIRREQFYRDLEEFCKRDAIEGCVITEVRDGKHYAVDTGETSIFTSDDATNFGMGEFSPLDSGWVDDMMTERWGEDWLDQFLEYEEEKPQFKF